jgi:hypothetical protein
VPGSRAQADSDFSSECLPSILFVVIVGLDSFNLWHLVERFNKLAGFLGN